MQFTWSKARLLRSTHPPAAAMAVLLSSPRRATLFSSNATCLLSLILEGGGGGGREGGRNDDTIVHVQTVHACSTVESSHLYTCTCTCMIHNPPYQTIPSCMLKYNVNVSKALQ